MTPSQLEKPTAAQIAMPSLTEMAVRARVREYADWLENKRGEPLEEKELANIRDYIRHRMFREEVQPLFDVKTQYIMLYPAPVIFCRDGRIERLEPEYPPHVKEAFAEIDKHIEDIATRYGYATIQSAREVTEPPKASGSAP